MRVALAPLWLLGACSLMVDTSEVDRGCPSGEKACFGECVPVEAPAYGCGADCQPCAQSVDNAIIGCVNGRCKVVACLDGYGCPDSNCRYNLLIDPRHCGACNQPCDGLCINGSCEPRPCDPEHSDCEGP